MNRTLRKWCRQRDSNSRPADYKSEGIDIYTNAQLSLILSPLGLLQDFEIIAY